MRGLPDCAPHIRALRQHSCRPRSSGTRCERRLFTDVRCSTGKHTAAARRAAGHRKRNTTCVVRSQATSCRQRSSCNVTRRPTSSLEASTAPARRSLIDDYFTFNHYSGFYCPGSTILQCFGITGEQTTHARSPPYSWEHRGRGLFKRSFSGEQRSLTND